MSNQIFQNVVCKMREVIGKEVGVLDDSGYIIACSDMGRNGDQLDDILDVIQNIQDPTIYEGYTFKGIGKNNRLECIVFVEGTDSQAEKYCELVSISIENVKQYHDSKYDKATFIKNVIFDNILPGDTAIKAKELHLSIDTPRVAFLIRSSGADDLYVYDTVRNLFPGKNKDFVFIIDDHDIVLIKSLKDISDSNEIENIANTIVDTINTEALVRIHVGIGTAVNSIKDLAKSYKEARVALEVGKVFDNEKYIISYDNLGIGRLIYQLPTTLCELFLAEIFKKQSIDALDQEIILTIKKFFENSLNVSETSRKLYVHRNTLVYRLDKIQKITGLDLRIFDHAIVFKVAMMVKKYLDSNPTKI